MVLTYHKPDDVAALIEQFNRIVSTLEKVQAGMALQGPKEAYFQVMKAKRYMDWLEQWSQDMEADYKKQRLLDHAGKSRTEMKTRKKGYRGKGTNK